ncbi:MAG: hypothetical protein E6G20_01670 [Actinobacteria bacterium]|nr:MAG: hypothetical protein E6G20_01670 [Actinomycetota bacterium]
MVPAASRSSAAARRFSSCSRSPARSFSTASGTADEGAGEPPPDRRSRILERRRLAARRLCVPSSSCRGRGAAGGRRASLRLGASTGRDLGGRAHGRSLADARTTYGNAKVAAEVAGRIGASVVVVVTSRWHERRAAALFRAALRRTGIRLALASAEGAAPRGARLRELACWTLVPPLTVYIGRRGRRGEGALPSASS